MARTHADNFADVAGEFSRTLRDDPSGPNAWRFLEDTLEGFAVNRADLEGEAVRQMELAKGSATEYIQAVYGHKVAENNYDRTFGELAENVRGEGEKLTETAIKQRVMRDVRMIAVQTELLNAETRLEAAKTAMKLFWERGENIRALLFSRNVEMRAVGAPTQLGTTSAAPPPGAMKARIAEKFGKKGKS